ncbi:hypothetical protein OAU50_01655 [Planctomycetota bacterium]|nr:hypothetical protein [Planctomycetota bacterium]
MSKLLTTIAAFSVAFCVSINTQAEEKKLPESIATYFSMSGDTIEDFKVTFSHPSLPDLTSARGAFDAWAAINDERKEFEIERRKLFYTWTDLGIKHLEPSEKALLHADCIADLNAERERMAGYRKKAPSYYNTPMTVKETKELEDGSIAFIAFYKEVSAAGDEEYVNFERITCKKCDDGKWRVNLVEHAGDDKLSETSEWYQSYGTLEMLYNYHGSVEATKSIPSLKQTDAEATVHSLFNHLCVKNWQLECLYNENVMGSYVKALESLCTKEWQDRLKKVAGYDKKHEARKPRTVMNTRDSEDGEIIVRLKPESDWNGPLDIHVKKDGDVWKIVSAWKIKLPKNEGGKESREQVKDIYSARWG